MSYKYIEKNGKPHYEGDVNEKQCTCVCCKLPIEIATGYKILPTKNDYKFLHVECKNLYSKKAKKPQKTYKHGFSWDILITTYCSEDSTALKNNEWIAISDKKVSLTSNTRNNLNNYKFMVQKAIVTIKNMNVGIEETFTYNNISMDNLTIEIDKESLNMGLYKKSKR